MSMEPRIETRPAQPYVAIPIQATLAEWGQVNALLGEVLGWLGQRNIPIGGPPVYRYKVIGDTEKKYDLEVGWIVSDAVEGDGRVISSEIPAGKYVSMTHVGHPDKLFDVSERMESWASNKGIELATRQDGDREIWDGRFQLFMTDPAVEPNPEKWAVEVLYLTSENAADGEAAGT